MSDIETKQREFFCELAAAEVALSWNEKTIYDGMNPKWLKIGKHSCSGSKICGVKGGTAQLSDWAKCPHIPRGRSLS
jgi:hypothetical protein